jgi:hypothetical protein
MFCPACAHNNPDGAAVCGACGTSLPAQGPIYAGGGPPPGYGPGPSPYVVQQRRTSGMAIAGFVLALVSCSILGLIFSIIGYNECKRSNGEVEGQGLALAGIIISIVWLALGIIYVIIVAAMVSGARHHGY